MPFHPSKILATTFLIVWLPRAWSGETSAKADLPLPDALGESPKPGWRWNVGLGTAWRQLGRLQFHTATEAGSAILPFIRPVLTERMPGSVGELSIGSVGAYSDRTYSDGFVFMDDSTATPSSFLPGTTAYWGYQSDSQARGGSLFYDAGTFATSSMRRGQNSRSRDWHQDIEGASPILEVEAFYPLRENFSIGGTFSFLFTSSDLTHTGTTFRAFQSLTERTFSVTDRYALQGIIPPAAPYAGTYSHPGTSPFIDNIPTQRVITESGRSERSADFYNRITESLSMDLHTISLGPTLRYETRNVFLAGSIGLAINIADWEASHVERLYQQTPGGRRQLMEWRDHSGKVSVLPAFYIQAAAGYKFSDHWDISVFGRQDWSKTLAGSVGPSDFSMDPGGYTIGGTLTFKF